MVLSGAYHLVTVGGMTLSGSLAIIRGSGRLPSWALVHGVIECIDLVDRVPIQSL